MTEQWLEDHAGLLMNHFISLIQMECDRYQASCKLLKDHYVAMEGGPGPNKCKIFAELTVSNFFGGPNQQEPLMEPVCLSLFLFP